MLLFLDTVSVFFKKYETEGKRKTTTAVSVHTQKKINKSDFKRNQDDGPKTQYDCVDLNTTRFLSVKTSKAKLGLHTG